MIADGGGGGARRAWCDGGQEKINDHNLFSNFRISLVIFIISFAPQRSGVPKVVLVRHSLHAAMLADLCHFLGRDRGGPKKSCEQR